MVDDRRAAVVGAAVVALFGLAALALVLLDAVSLRSQVHVTVYFENIGNLNTGSDVAVAGKTIGRVDSVQLVPARSASSPEHPLFPTGGVAVRVSIERRYIDRALKNGEYFINFRGVFGASFLEIGPPPAGEGLGRALAQGDELRGVDPPLLDRVLLRSFQNLTSSRLFLAAIKPEAKRVAAAVTDLSETLRQMEPQPGAYEQVGAALAEMSAEANDLAEILNGQVDIDAIRGLAQRTDQTLARIDSELASLRTGIDRLRADIAALGDKVPPDLRARFLVAAARARSSVARLQSVTRDARALMAAINRGDGTVGALLNDPEFIDDAKKLGKVLKRQPWRLMGNPGDR